MKVIKRRVECGDSQEELVPVVLLSFCRALMSSRFQLGHVRLT